MTGLGQAKARAVGLAVFIALLAALLGACAGGGDAQLTTGAPEAAPVTTGGGGSGSGGGFTPLTPKNTCGILNEDDVARAVGNPVGKPSGEGKFCFWGTQVDKGTSADVTVHLPTAGRSTELCTSQQASLSREARRDPVSGLGNSAVWAWQQVAVLIQGSLLACWNDAVIVVGITGEKDQGALRAAATNLINTVRGRL